MCMEITVLKSNLACLLASFLLGSAASADEQLVTSGLNFHCESLEYNRNGERMQAHVKLIHVHPTATQKELVAVVMRYMFPQNPLAEVMMGIGEDYVFVDGETRNVCYNNGKDKRFKAKKQCDGAVAVILGYNNPDGLNQVKVQSKRVFFTENLEAHDGQWNVLNLDTGRLHHATAGVGDLQCAVDEQPE